MANKPPSWVFFTLAICGLWLMTSTASFGFQSKPLVISDLVSGFLILVISLSIRKNPTTPMLWVIAFIGIWLQFAPLLFWAPTSGAYITNTLIGTLVMTFSVILFPMPNQVPDIEPTIPPGWTYNPSSWAQRTPIAFFVFICWMTSRYLAAYQLGYIDTVWDPFFPDGTKRVLESSVSKLFPVPDAGLGAFVYTLEFLFTCQGGKARWRTSPWGVLVFGILVIPASTVSVILIILQPLVVGTWCSLCLLTAVCMLIPIPLAIDEVVASLQYLRREKFSMKALFFGGESSEAKEDQTSPTWNESLKGVSFPWNLIVTMLIGIYLMTFKQLDPMLGALTIVFSVISFSEHLRFARYLNIVVAFFLIFFSMLIEGAFLFHGILAIALILLSLRKGRYANHSL